MHQKKFNRPLSILLVLVMLLSLFVNSAMVVSVDAVTSALSITGITVPDSVEKGEKITVTASVYNQGEDSSGQLQLKLYAAPYAETDPAFAEVDATEAASLAAKETKEFEMNWTPEEAGSYLVKAEAIGGESAVSSEIARVEVKAAPEPVLMPIQTQELGTVKVRVADEVQRLSSEMPNLGADYRQPFGEILPFTEVPITEGMTIREALEVALATKEIRVIGEEDYVEGIGPVTSEAVGRTVTSLSEFDSGNQSGWMVNLNDWFIDKGAHQFTVKDGDVVEWLYTCNLGADLGATGNDKTLKSISVSHGILSPVFSSASKEYTLTLSGEGKVIVALTAANRSNKVTIESGGESYRRTDEIAVTDGQVISIYCAGNTYTITVKVQESDQSVADTVIAMISALPATESITLADKDEIQSVRTNYEMLTDAQKALVTNYSVLQAAEAKIAQMEADNKAAADHVAGLIAAIPALDMLTLNDQTQVEAARTAYASLTDDQKALVTNLSVLAAAEIRITELLNPDDTVAKNYSNDFLLSVTAINIKEGGSREINVFDTPRVGGDDLNYSRNDLRFDILSGSGVASVEKVNDAGLESTAKYYVKGLAPGKALIKVSYTGYAGQDTVIAVYVRGRDEDEPDFTTGLDNLTKYDTIYFTGKGLDYSFDAGEGASAELDGKMYPAEDGEITVHLKDGYNAIFVTEAGETKAYNVRAKKVSYVLENLTRKGSSNYYVGDTIKITFTGLVTPAPKVSRIYNPADTHFTYMSSMPRQSYLMGERTQYGLPTSSMEVLLTGTGEQKLSGGYIAENWFGGSLYAELPDSDPVPGAGGGGNAAQNEKAFSYLPDIAFTVKANSSYTPELFEPEIKNTLEIWPGDTVKIEIPGLDTETIAEEHQPGQSWVVDLLDSYTVFSTDIPGVNFVKSENVTKLEDLEKLKNLEFQVPESTTPGTYVLKGGYVWVKYGPTWWTREMTYFQSRIQDIAIEVKTPDPDSSHGGVDIQSQKLYERLKTVLEKPEGYSKKITEDELGSITGELDLSGTEMTNGDMAILKFLKKVSSLNLANNTAITSVSVVKETFDWTTLKTINFSGCTGITSIGSAAFSGCSNLSGITLPVSVKSIGDEAFKQCTGLTAFELPEGLESIGNAAFYYCLGLKEITLSSTVKTIGTQCFYNDYALKTVHLSQVLESIPAECFRNCSVLEGITIPDSVKSIGTNAFYNCAALSTVSFADGLESIGEGAFYNCPLIKEAVLPESVVSIGKNAFYSCKSLKKVQLSSKITAIPETCFAYCSSMDYLVVPKDVSAIGNYAFTGCTALVLLDMRGTAFTAPNSLWGIPATTAVLMGTDAQLSYSGSIHVAEAPVAMSHIIPAGKTLKWGTLNPLIATVDNGQVTGVETGKTLVYVTTGDYSFGGACEVTVTDEGSATLSALSLSGITLNQTFSPVKYNYTADITGENRSTQVTLSATNGALKLKVNDTEVQNNTPSADIPLHVGSNIITIQVTDETQGITKTYKITMTMPVLYVGADYLVIGNPGLQAKAAAAAGKDSAYTGRLTFSELSAVKNAELSGAGMTDADMGLMKYFTGAESINLSDNPALTSAVAKSSYFDWTIAKSLDFTGCSGITSIAASAFANCTNLKGIKLPAAAASIGKSAFSGCTGMQEVLIPEGVKTIGDTAFMNCGRLTSVAFPSTVTSLGNQVFSGCAGLKNADFSKIGSTKFGTEFLIGCSGFTNTNQIKFSATIAELPNGFFKDCKGITQASLPANITKLGQYTFRGCSSLIEADISHATALDTGTFYECTALQDMTKITWSANVSVLPTYCFRNCTGLTKVVLPSTITEIKDFAFSGCAGITEADLTHIIKLGNTVLENCTGITDMKSVKLNASITTLPNGLFKGTSISKIELPEQITALGANAFYSCTKLKVVDLKNITDLGTYTLRNCTGITDMDDVMLNDSITALPAGFFQGCTGIAEIKLPDRIKSLGDYSLAYMNVEKVDLSKMESVGKGLLEYCPNLKKVVFPSGMTALPNEFFLYSTISSLKLPEEFTSVGSNAFYNAKAGYLKIPAKVTSMGNNCLYSANIAILDMRDTGFESLDSTWGNPASAFVLFKAVNDAQLTSDKISVNFGGKVNLSHAIPSDKQILWAVSNPSLGSINNGVFTAAYTSGTVYIAVKSSDDTYSGVIELEIVDSAETVAGMIESIPEIEAITLGDKEDILKAREAYDSLEDDQKEALGQELTAKLMTAVDKIAALEVDAFIEALPSAGEITLSDKDSVEAARAAYEALTDGQKALVTGLPRLAAAEEKLRELTEGQPATDIEKVRAAISGVEGYLDTSGYLSDWVIVGYGNSGVNIPANYLSSLADDIAAYFENSVNTSSERVTDHERRSIALAAAGKDPTNIGGHNLIERIYNFYVPAKNRDITFQGLNGVIFGLIALDAGEFPVPEDARYSRDWLISYLLNNQNEDGGWDLAATGTSDVDITGMTLQALAPYYTRAEVKTSVDRAVNWLSTVQRPDGGFASTETVNSEAISQAVIALCANGISPASEAFTKNGKNLLDALLTFRQDDGSFGHILTDEGDNMATEQAYLALLAYDRFVQAGEVSNGGKTSIYYFGPVQGDDTTAPVITTDLTDRTVTASKLAFTASASDAVDGILVPVVKVGSKTISGTNGAFKAELSEGANTITVTATDYSGNKAEKSFTVTYTPNSQELPAGDQQPTIEIPKENGDYKIPITAGDNDKEITIQIPGNKESKVLVELPSNTALPQIEAVKGNVSALIPKGAQVVSGDASALELITSGDTTDPELAAKVEQALPAGKNLDEIALVFSMGGSQSVQFSEFVTLTFTGMSGKDAAYIQDGNLHLIQKYAGDSEGLSSGKNEYAYDSGNDLIVKTKHFTDFIAYTSDTETSTPGGGGGSGGKEYVTPSVDKLTIEVEATRDANGKATATVTGAALSDLLKKAQEEAGSGSALATLTVKGLDGAKVLDVVLPKEAVSALVKAKNITLKISSGLSELTFDQIAAATVANAATSASAEITITVAAVPVDTLSDEAKAAVGNRPVYDFSVSVGNTAVSTFGGGSVRVGIPYTPAANEDKNAIVIYRINDKGELEVVKNGRYDAETGLVSFSAKHFSRYAVGCNQKSFTDTTGKWMQQAVEYMAARGIIEGVDKNKFAPDQKTTRAQFVALLMRALEPAADTSKVKQFSDAAAGKYYADPVLQARALGLVDGAGDNRFNPDETITREQMFTITYRALEKLGLLDGYEKMDNKPSFSDKAAIAGYAAEAVDALASYGLVTGSDGKLNPEGLTSRAECAQFLYNVLTGMK
ncbi:leucine-rich repeat protein [Candidatus Formimonas warabiya]|nr:leucine-rich repeat protein [Candidatus Formimonas warabiya]